MCDSHFSSETWVNLCFGREWYEHGLYVCDGELDGKTQVRCNVVCGTPESATDNTNNCQHTTTSTNSGFSSFHAQIFRLLLKISVERNILSL